MDGPDIRVTSSSPPTTTTTTPAQPQSPPVENCPVCQHVPIAPRQLSPCGHYLCEVCWVELFQHDSFDALCPYCRSNIETTEPSVLLELACRLMYGEDAYKTHFAANRERVVSLALEPARTRPPLEILRTEQANAEAAYRKNVDDYEKAKGRVATLVASK